MSIARPAKTRACRGRVSPFHPQQRGTDGTCRRKRVSAAQCKRSAGESENGSSEAGVDRRGVACKQTCRLASFRNGDWAPISWWLQPRPSWLRCCARPQSSWNGEGPGIKVSILAVGSDVAMAEIYTRRADLAIIGRAAPIRKSKPSSGSINTRRKNGRSSAEVLRLLDIPQPYACSSTLPIPSAPSQQLSCSSHFEANGRCTGVIWRQGSSRRANWSTQ